MRILKITNYIDICSFRRNIAHGKNHSSITVVFYITIFLSLHSLYNFYLYQLYQAIVFIHEDLNEEEKTKVLAHENGHIYLGHFSSSQVIGKDVQEEYEANEFAHYLQTDSVATKMQNGLIKYKKTWLAVVAIVLVLAIALAIFGWVMQFLQ